MHAEVPEVFFNNGSFWRGGTPFLLLALGDGNGQAPSRNNFEQLASVSIFNWNERRLSVLNGEGQLATMDMKTELEGLRPDTEYWWIAACDWTYQPAEGPMEGPESPEGQAGVQNGTVYAAAQHFRTAVARITPNIGTASSNFPTGLSITGFLEVEEGASWTEAGIQISEEESFPQAGSRKVAAGNVEAGQTFFVEVDGLRPHTTYYYRAYATHSNGMDVFGEPEAIQTVGFDEMLRISVEEVTAFDFTLEGLNSNTRYYYRGYIVVNGTEYACETLRFFDTPFVHISSVALDPSAKTCANLHESFTLTPVFSPANPSDPRVKWSSSDTSVATVDENGLVHIVGVGPASATISVQTLDGAKKASCPITVTPNVSSLERLTKGKDDWSWVAAPDNHYVAGFTATLTGTTTDGTNLSVSLVIDFEGAVDLGTSVKWSTMNIGASSREDFGAYYRWGETEAVSHDPLDDNYKWGYIYAYGKWYYSKYVTDSQYGESGFTDGLATLEKEDDVAQVELGGNWRMPTWAEFNELLDACEVTKITTDTQAPYWLFTSKANERQIRFPYLTNGSVFGCWSSSLNESNNRGAGLMDLSNETPQIKSSGRANEQQVRPVRIR